MFSAILHVYPIKRFYRYRLINIILTAVQSCCLALIGRLLTQREVTLIAVGQNSLSLAGPLSSLRI